MGEIVLFEINNSLKETIPQTKYFVHQNQVSLVKFTNICIDIDSNELPNEEIKINEDKITPNIKGIN